MSNSTSTPDAQQLEQVRAWVEAVAGAMPDASWELGHDLFSVCRIDKGGYLLHAGDVSTHVYVVFEGVLRQFYTTESGNEVNKSFAVEGEGCGAFHSSLTGKPSRFSIQALEPCLLLGAPFAQLLRLFDLDRHWERLGRRAAEQQAMENETREAELLLDSATTRYERFCVDHADLERRIPQYHIASYLGITNVALSRIRRRLLDRQGDVNPGS